MNNITDVIHRLTGRDISAYTGPFLEKIIRQRIQVSKAGDEEGYFHLLQSSMEEADELIGSLNISYTLFNRSPLDYSIIEQYILPSLFQRKQKFRSSSLRIWSAGCADGAEPYTFAMIGLDVGNDLQMKSIPLVVATDISGKVLEKAKRGFYYPQSLENVNQHQMESFFIRTDDGYQIKEVVKKQVEFSLYDLLDTKTTSPPSGIFGGFDMVICCNVMVYYKREVQNLIMTKLYHALSPRGFLMVDSSEKAIVKSFDGFRSYASLSNIFVKY